MLWGVSSVAAGRKTKRAPQPPARPGAAVAIDASGWKDVVVWNPHLTMKVQGGGRLVGCVRQQPGIMGSRVWEGLGPGFGSALRFSSLCALRHTE